MSDLKEFSVRVSGKAWTQIHYESRRFNESAPEVIDRWMRELALARNIKKLRPRK